MWQKKSLYVALCLSIAAGCAEPENITEDTKIFRKTASATTHLTFANTLKENDTINYFKYPYIYMGGGSATGDVNGDGLQDIYLTGNMVSNSLYLNQGELAFQDITDVAQVGADDRWVTGAAMADINADGLLDIYVSVSGLSEPRGNLLYINKGNNTEGIPVFEEEAALYGLADTGHTTQATFLDYDQDGDLDVFVANYPPTSFKARVAYYRRMIDKPEHEMSSHLYQNNGDKFFTDVTKEAGLLSFGLSLSATAGDFNQDGFTDLYVSNDFSSPDFFYFNNGDGTFTDRLHETTNQTAFYGMGSDAADYNNDGLLDLIQVDMTPEDNRRSKANMASMNIPGFWEVVNYGFHYQYMQNALQLNRGIQANGLPFFSNVSQLGNVALTDWSWSPLFADFDNDGWKDLMISNGTRRDINHKDYFNKIDEVPKEEKEEIGFINLTEDIPSEKIDNYIFRNNGDLSFTRANADWGFEYEGFSNGASYADLDNDGDLDVIINNIDDDVALFENLSAGATNQHFLRLELKGPDSNPLGIGTKAKIANDGKVIYLEHNMVRGFQSSSDQMMHFGLGEKEIVQELTVIWPDGKYQTFSGIAADQVLSIDYADATEEYQTVETPATLFVELEDSLHRHRENRFSDYDMQILLPHKLSQNGPALAVGDVNGDGLDDFYTGGSTTFKGFLYVQNSDGSFEPMAGPWESDSLSEDVGAVFFDANGDNRLDLYIASGGNEWAAEASEYGDRLYLNTEGGFIDASKSLPELFISGMAVVPGDYDADGDLDLFIGGRIMPQTYPLAATSVILENRSRGDKIIFEVVSPEIAPELNEVGMVSSAVWDDYNGDGNLDLIIAGEWMPIMVFEQQNGVFEYKENTLSNTSGWWFSLKKADVDMDGDMDLLAGNLGLNYKYKASEEATFDIYAGDYDKNEKLDIVLGYYNDGVQYPVRGRQCSSQQIMAIKVKYQNYDDFAIASLDDIYTETDLSNSLHYSVADFSSGWFENQGDGSYKKHAFANEAQVSVIQDFIYKDFDGDGIEDMLLAGNFYVSEIETPRADASVGLFMKGSSGGNFTPVATAESGFFVPGDVRKLGLIQTSNGEKVIVANNAGQLQQFEVSKNSTMLSSK